MTGGSILPVRDSGVIHQQLPREIRAFWFCCLSLFRYYRCCLWLLEVVLFSVTDLREGSRCEKRGGLEYGDGGCGFLAGVMITIVGSGGWATVVIGLKGGFGDGGKRRWRLALKAAGSATGEMLGFVRKPDKTKDKMRKDKHKN
ncbi:hypothetical protein NC651_026083 [Populus alba x Populus x berolinensis]|nr:hypothetical protein NC651_026083 [Populus alba x Populus x berolinensis]